MVEEQFALYFSFRSWRINRSKFNKRVQELTIIFIYKSTKSTRDMSNYINDTKYTTQMCENVEAF